MRNTMERAWRVIPLAITVFALSFIGWMIHMLRLAWTRNDSWGFTVTVASVVIPIFLVYLWLALHVLWGIAREGSGSGREGRP